MKQARNYRHEPSDNEKCQKIKQAIQAISEGRIIILEGRHNQLALDFLGADDMDEVLDWVAVFLEEIDAIGPARCFVGRHVYRCDHAPDLFLFAYHWDSPSIEERVYLKFGIRTVTTTDGKKYTYCHLDCHEDKPNHP